MTYARNILTTLKESFDCNKVVLLNGARQVGKSTLIKDVLSQEVPLHYVTLDDKEDLLSLQGDPKTFLKQFQGSVVIDEVQRAPNAFVTIKRITDTKKDFGQFLLTGSMNVLMLPKLSESLAGRMVIHTMWPLSQGEIRGVKETFLDSLFTKDSFVFSGELSDQEWASILVTGGYPHSLEIKRSTQRNIWFRSYIETILQKDIKELSDIEKLQEIPNILSIIASRVGNFMNLSDVGRVAGVKTTTMQRYATLLKAVFLMVEVPAWFVNYEKRLIKAPKVYLNDTGLLCHLMSLDEAALIENKNVAGHVFENFVCMELIKQISWSDSVPINLYHFRTQRGEEVDFVLEGPGGKIVGIEVKSKRVCSLSDIEGLKKLQDLSKEKFHRGIVLYRGEKTVFLDHNILAIPVTALWNNGGRG